MRMRNFALRLVLAYLIAQAFWIVILTHFRPS
jgi:hypothetical protein